MDYQLLFAGSSIEVLLLKGLLQEQGIFPLDKDRAKSGVLAGFYGGELVQVFVKEDDLERAKQILEDFQENKNKE